MSPKISIEHVNPFLKATIETYSSMMGTVVKPGKPVLRQGRGIQYDISGIIGITGDVKGAVALSYPEAAILKTVSAFLQEEMTEMNDDVMDATGELANIIAGYAKRFLQDFKISISLPTVIRGHGLVIKEPPDVFSFVVPFECDLGNFDLGVGLKPSDE